MFDKKTAKLEYKIKLLSGDNVVLVEANGYDSEIFMPEIVSGRLSLQNVIPNRRCLCTPALHSISHNNNNTSKTSKSSRSVDVSNSLPHSRKPFTPLNTKSFRMVAGQESAASNRFTGNPLSHSTPAKRLRNELSKDNSTLERRTLSRSSQSSQVLQTPEPARCCPVRKETIVRIPPGIKVLRLYRNPTAGTPKKVGRVIGSFSNESGSTIPTARTPSPKDLSKDVSPSFRLPSVPSLNSNNSLNCSKNSLVRKPATLCPKGTIVTSPFANKWRKCITPIRTYSRRGILNIQRRSSAHRKFSHGKRVVPTYMVNPTQCPKPNKKIQVRKRKLIIDHRVAISPRTFKKQQTHIDDLSSITKKMHSQLPKTRKQYENSKQSAFDMLTNPNRRRCVSNVLAKQFQKGCINKASSTNPKYKLLCTAPPLQYDAETNEIRRQQQEEEYFQSKINNPPMDHATAAAMVEKACIQAAQKYVNFSKNMKQDIKTT